MSTNATPMKDLSDRLAKALHLESVPIGVMFMNKQPDGIPRFDRGTLKACMFWDVPMEPIVYKFRVRVEENINQS